MEPVVNNKMKSLLEAIGYYKDGRYICAIKKLYKLPQSDIVRFYLVKSFAHLSDVFGIIDSIKICENTKVKCDYELPYSKLSDIKNISNFDLFKSKKESFLKSTICGLDKLVEMQKTILFDNTINEKKKIIERFLLENHLLIIFWNKLSDNQKRHLSNIINILGDICVSKNEYKYALACYKFSTALFSDNFYSRVNFADLAYKIRHYELCLSNLKHANHLLYYAQNSINNLYNPYLDSFELVPEVVVQNFRKLSRNVGFIYG